MEGRQAKRAEDLESAVALYTRALGYGYYGEWLLSRVDALLELGDHANALRDAEWYLAKYPNSSETTM